MTARDHQPESCHGPSPPVVPLPPVLAVDPPVVARVRRTLAHALCRAACGAGLVALSSAFAWAGGSDIILPIPSFTASTVPANGDVNPYGIAFVPRGVPSWSTLKPGDVVVSNFNAASNTQGTGTTIVKLSPGRTPAAFSRAAISA